MAFLNDKQLQDMVGEINSSNEVDRRAKHQRRHEMYQDGGRRFLIEELEREFSNLDEMRLCVINYVKKIVDSKSILYKKPPLRTTESDQDQALIDFYTEELDFNSEMAKANRYYNLHANVSLYPVSTPDGFIKFSVVPPQLYSKKQMIEGMDFNTTYIFSRFTEEGQITSSDALNPATGRQGFSKERGSASRDGNAINSNEKRTDTTNRIYIVWNDDTHVTLNSDGVPIMDSSLDETQFINVLGRAPVTEIQKETDGLAWAPQGQDMIDLSMELQKAWTDVLTIQKIQGFGIPVIISREEPKRLTIGMTKTLWLKQEEGMPDPSISFVQAESRLSEMRQNIDELTNVLFTTYSVDPGSIGGRAASKNTTSGFHALISMAPTLEAAQLDVPKFINAEQDTWQVIALWHNWMFDQGILRDDAKSLGRFSNEFKLAISFTEIRPLESQAERIADANNLRDMGLVSNAKAMKMIFPDMTDAEIEKELEEIEEEKSAKADKAQSIFGGSNGQIHAKPESEGAEESREGSEEISDHNTGHGEEDR